MFRNLTPVVKNLIIINALMLFITFVMDQSFGMKLENILGFHYFESNLFKPYQLITYMFMHGGVMHLLFNMYALFLFGVMLENVWGGKRFFLYYVLCGLGAIIFQSLVNYIEFNAIQNHFEAIVTGITPSAMSEFINKQFPIFDLTPGSYLDQLIRSMPTGVEAERAAREIYNFLIQERMSIPTVGASGAVFGILLAFGMIFPNMQLMLLIPPMPIKAKWLVLIYGLMELAFGITRPGDSVAHFAHLGGMLIGFILIKLWAHRNPPQNYL